MSFTGIVPTFVLDIALVMLAVCLMLTLYRIVRGPTVPDRAVASDAIGTCIMAAITVYSLKANSLQYIPAAMVIAILGFLSVVVIAKYIGGESDVIDRNRS
jgi:multicomponent Na+:H+ antiporter subunit F